MAYMEFMNSKVVKDNDGKRKVLLRKEFVCNSFDDLSEIDTSNLLMGSIAYSISDGKLAVWDGSEYWVDTDGESHGMVVACTLGSVSVFKINPPEPPKPFDYTSDTLTVQETPVALVITSADDPTTPLTDMTNIVSKNSEVATAEIGAFGSTPVLEVTSHVTGEPMTTTISVDLPSKGCTLILNVYCEAGK